MNLIPAAALAVAALAIAHDADAQSLPRVDVSATSLAASTPCPQLQAQLDERLQYAWRQQAVDSDVQLRFRPRPDGLPEVQVLTGSRAYASAAKRAVVNGACEGDGQTWYRVAVRVSDGEAGQSAVAYAEPRR